MCMHISGNSCKKCNMSSLNSHLSSVSESEVALGQVNMLFSKVSSFFSAFPWGLQMLLLFIPLRGCGAYWGQLMGEGNCRTLTDDSFIVWIGQLLNWLPHRVSTAHQEQFWGSVTCSRILRHVAQSHPRGTGDSNQQPSDYCSTSSTHWATAAPIFLQSWLGLNEARQMGKIGEKTDDYAGK